MTKPNNRKLITQVREVCENNGYDVFPAYSEKRKDGRRIKLSGYYYDYSNRKIKDKQLTSAQRETLLKQAEDMLSKLPNGHLLKVSFAPESAQVIIGNPLVPVRVRNKIKQQIRQFYTGEMEWVKLETAFGIKYNALVLWLKE